MKNAINIGQLSTVIILSEKGVHILFYVRARNNSYINYQISERKP